MAENKRYRTSIYKRNDDFRDTHSTIRMSGFYLDVAAILDFLQSADQPQKEDHVIVLVY